MLGRLNVCNPVERGLFRLPLFDSKSIISWKRPSAFPVVTLIKFLFLPFWVGILEPFVFEMRC
jgi:hypothetical protein